MATSQVFHFMEGDVSRSAVLAVFEQLRQDKTSHDSWSKVGRIAFSDQIFPSDDLATEYLEREVLKEGPAVACRIRKIKKEFKDSIDRLLWEDELVQLHMKVVASYNDSVMKGRLRLKKLEFQVFKEFKNSELKYINCPSCESRLNRSFLQNFCCPVCEYSLIENSQLLRLHTQVTGREKALGVEQKKLRDQLTAVKKEIEKMLGAEDYYWLISAKITI